MQPAGVFYLLLIIGILIAGCASPAGTGQDVSSNPTYGPAIPGLADFSPVTHVDVAVIGRDWDAVFGNDGVIIYPDLKDAKQQSVLWEGTPLVADVEIWSTMPGSDMKETKDQLVYRGSANITSWRDGKILMGGGIKVPFSSMSVPAGKTRGRTYTTIHVPDGNAYTGISETTPLIP
jgi:predicted small secreted protein